MDDHMHSARPPENDALDGGLWLSIAEVARAKGKTRQSVHERVGHLVDAGLLEVRREGRTKLINLAQYDIAIGATGDGVKEAGAATKRDAIGEPMSPKFREAQTRERQYVADLKFLELQERLRKLVPISEVESAVQICAATIVESLERLPRRADDLALAVGRDGAHGARKALKAIVFEMRNEIAAAFCAVASADRASLHEAVQVEIRRRGYPGPD